MLEAVRTLCARCVLTSQEQTHNLLLTTERAHIVRHQTSDPAEPSEGCGSPASQQ